MAEAQIPGGPAQLRLRAEACRQLAGMADDAQSKALWTERANHWDKLTAKAEKRRRSPRLGTPNSRILR
jgi:hypothetical protein